MSSAGDSIRIEHIPSFQKDERATAFDVELKEMNPLNVGSHHVPKGTEPSLRSDDIQDLALSPSSSKKLRYVVRAVVIIGIICFAAFQIRESAQAHQNPGSVSSIMSKPRLFPGLLICPFSAYEVEDFPFANRLVFDSSDALFCPKWTDSATLSFDYQTLSLPSGETIDTSPFLFNTNSHVASNRQKDTCPSNNVGVLFESKGGVGIAELTDALFLGKGVDIDGEPFPIKFRQFVTVKNKVLSRPRVHCYSVYSRQDLSQAPQTVCSQCSSWTPPNVRCLAYDPLLSQTDFAKYGLDQKCNPMAESSPNSVDTLLLISGTPDDINPEFNSGTSARKPDEGFRYTGLIPQPTASAIGRSPSSQFVSLFDLMKQNNQSKFDGFLDGEPNLNRSLFGGLMAVFYNPNEGVPKELDFNTAPLVGSDTVSLAILLKNSAGKIVEAPPSSWSVKTHYDYVYSNFVSQTYHERVSYSVTGTVVAEERSSEPNRDTFGPKVLVRFADPSSSSLRQVINPSVLTTLSIILSTAATLWSARDKIQEVIVFIMSKLKKKVL
jgi:hypothetical protein